MLFPLQETGFSSLLCKSRNNTVRVAPRERVKIEDKGFMSPSLSETEQKVRDVPNYQNFKNIPNFDNSTPKRGDGSKYNLRPKPKPTKLFGSPISSLKNKIMKKK